jgi:hypothetical protein
MQNVIEIHQLFLQFVHVNGGKIPIFFHPPQRMLLQNNALRVPTIAGYHSVRYCLQCDADRCACASKYIFIYIL